MAESSQTGSVSKGNVNLAKPKLVAVPVKPPFSLTPIERMEKYLKLLIYGDFGVGKTYLAGTSVDVSHMNDVLLLNAESGDLTLGQDVGGHEFTKITAASAKSYKQIGAIYAYLKLHCQHRDENNIEKLKINEATLRGCKPEDIEVPKKFNTVIIDSLTEAETYCMNQLLGVTDSTELDEEVAVAGWPEFKRNRHMVNRMIRNFRDLPMHVILTCHRNYNQDEQKRMLYTPQMTGQLAKDVQGFMDMVGYLEIVQGTTEGSLGRRLHIQPTGRFAAKSRFSTYSGSHFDDPTINSILEAVGLSRAQRVG